MTRSIAGLPVDSIPKKLTENPMHAATGGGTGTGTRRYSAEVDSSTIYKEEPDEHPVRMTQNPLANQVMEASPTSLRESEMLEEIPL